MSSIEFEAVREFFKKQKAEERRLKKERLQHEQERLQHEQERLRLQELEQERLQMFTRLGARLLNRELTADEVAALSARLPQEDGAALLDQWLGSTPEQVEAWLQQAPGVEVGEG